MSALYKKLFMLLTGTAAGLASWTVMEILLYYGEEIGRHIIWNGLTGAFIGLFFGFFFGSAEGVMFSDSQRAIRGGIIGAALGLLGGAAAVILAQGLVYLIGNTEFFTSSVSESLVVPLSRAAGWGILGLVVGSLEGIRNKSGRRTLIGMAGGFLGGFLGGALLEFLARVWSNELFSRGTGLVILGIGTGLFLGVFEYSRSFGIVRILTGPYKGKDYILTMRKTKLGTSPWTHIPLKDYMGVENNHAHFSADNNGVTISEEQGKVLVNDFEVSSQELKYEDVIQIGSAKLLYLPR